MDDTKKIQAKNMQVGKIYIGTPVGEFQKDKNGKIFWKRVDGTIQEVKPHPDSIFTELKDVEE